MYVPNDIIELILDYKYSHEIWKKKCWFTASYRVFFCWDTFIIYCILVYHASSSMLVSIFKNGWHVVAKPSQEHIRVRKAFSKCPRTHTSFKICYHEDGWWYARFEENTWTLCKHMYNMFRPTHKMCRQTMRPLYLPAMQVTMWSNYTHTLFYM